MEGTLKGCEVDYSTYKKIRAYCWQDLSAYIDTPFNNDTLQLKRLIVGNRADIEHEHAAAMGLFQTSDLTPREQAAAHLLAVISNHRAIAWHREPDTPNDREPAAPLEPWQSSELRQQTINAISEYAAFVPEREAAALLAMMNDTAPAQTAATPAPVEVAKRRENKPTIETVALDYMRAEFKQGGQFPSASKFHKHLIKTAGLDKSPFEMGRGTNVGMLFCPAASSFFDAGTLGKMWPKIRAV